jgi:predicted permease
MNTVETLWQDLRYALRVLLKSPAFTCVAVLSLALGIGINTAVFTLVNAVLLRALPYPEPEQLVHVSGPNGAISIPEYQFWKEHSTVFSSAAGYRGTAEQRLAIGAGSAWIQTLTITTDFFRTLSVNPAFGREFNSEETHSGGPQAIVLSDGLWRRSFGADPQVVGRAIALDDASYTIVGILPRNFWFPETADAFVPLRPSGGLTDSGTNTQMIARLKPGVTVQQAQDNMFAVTAEFRRTYESRLSLRYRGLSVIPYRRWLVGDVRLNLLLLFGAVGLLLLIACSNLAALLLTRLAARWKEIAVRLAMGSSSGRLLRQFLVENLLLVASGSVAGVIGGNWLLRGLLAAIPFDLPAAGPIQLDRPVLVFTFLIGLATALAFTLVPFWSSTRLNVHEALKAAGRSAGTGSARQRTRNVLVVGEVALSTTLLIAAGLLIQSLYRIHQERLGFTPEGLLTFVTPLQKDQHSDAAALTRFVGEALERLQTIPGVHGVAAANSLPLTGPANIPTQREGHAEQSIGGMEIRVVTPAYFQMMGIPVRRGRIFTANDTGASQPVAVVNEAVARRWWPRGDALGDHVVIGLFRGRTFPQIKDFTREVVGVVADMKTYAVTEPARPTVFVPAMQASDGIAHATSSWSWIVRAPVSSGMTGQLRRAITSIDSRQRVKRFQLMTDIVASTTASSRFDAWLFGAFAAIALALASIGVYGLLSFSVAQRRQEIGTRMALGASRTQVLQLVLKQGFALTIAGLVIGVVGALFVTRWFETLLYGVRPGDPLSFLAVSLLLVVVGLAASYLPARRATNIDPMVALRYE